MLRLIVIIEFLAATLTFDKKTVDPLEMNSFYLYTTEKIENAKYTSVSKLKEHKIPNFKLTSRLNFEDINFEEMYTPDSLDSYLYKITYQMISESPTTISLLDSNSTPVIHINILDSINNEGDCVKDMSFVKVFPSDDAEQIFNLKMLCERNRKSNFYEEHEIIVIGENFLSLQKLKINLECYAVLHNLKTIKRDFNIITSISLKKAKSQNENDEKALSDKVFWLNIYHVLSSFDYFTTNLISRAFKLFYKLDGFNQENYYEKPDGPKIVNLIVDNFLDLKEIVTKCLKICKDVKIIEIYKDNGTTDFYAYCEEIKRVFYDILDFYRNLTTLKDVSNIKIATREDINEHFKQVAQFAKQYLEFITIIENFLITLESSENLSLECQVNDFNSLKNYLDVCLISFKKHTTYPLNSNLTENENITFLEGYTLEMIEKNCDTVLNIFNDLIEISNKEFFSENFFTEMFVDFRDKVSSFKENVIKYGQKIEFTIFGNYFLKNVLNNSIIFNYSETMSTRL